MGFRALLAEIGQRTDMPETFDAARAPHRGGHVRLFGQAAQHGQVDRLGRGGEFGARWRAFQVGDERGQGIEARLRLTPEQAGQRGEAMLFDGIDFLVGKFGIAAARAGQRAERAVLVMPSGAPGDLGHFRRGQPAMAMAVVFRQASKGDMLDIEVEAHAHGVGRHEVIDLARLVHRHLGVAGLWA